MSSFKVSFYAEPDGTEPAKDFLLGLDKKMRAKMLRTIGLLAANGNRLREPYSKMLRDGILELRAKVGSDISRVLYFFVVNHDAILTHGFIKKTQKTPQAEIERALKCRKEYLERRSTQ